MEKTQWVDTREATNILAVVFANTDRDDMFWSDNLFGMLRLHQQCTGHVCGEGIEIMMIEAGRYYFQGIPSPYKTARDMMIEAVSIVKEN